MKTVIELARAGLTEAFRELAKLEGVSPEKFRDRVARGRSSLLETWRGLPSGWLSSGKGCRRRLT
jgi:phosphomethylpyrimidine synthase